MTDLSPTDLLQQRLAAAATHFPGHYGLAARNLRTGEEILVDADALYPTASTYKVPVMIEVFRRVELGEMDLTDEIVFTKETLRLGSGVMRDLTPGRAWTLHDLIVLMIIVSDNTATRMLLQHVGGNAAVNATMRELGYPSHVIHSAAERAAIDATGELNRGLAECAPRDLMAMLAAIAEDRMISPDASAEMRRILGRQHYLNQASRFLGRDQYTDDAGDVQQQIWVGSKSGMMSGMRADTGIWRFPDGTQIAFAVMNEGSADHDFGTEHEGDILNGVLGWIIASHWWDAATLGPLPTVASPYLTQILGDLAR